MTDTTTDTTDAARVAALDAIFKPANRSDAPGLVVAVAEHGKVVYRKGFGLASVEHGNANTPATRMRIASVTKQFTCLCALLLAEEGKLDLDASVHELIPELPRLEGYPTLRQFMSHTSGRHDAADMAFMAHGLAQPPAGFVLDWSARQTGVNFAPGHGQLYCNTGYVLLSLAIERASKKPFETVMKERVFTPLGLVDTELVPSDMTIVPGLATMHQALPDGSWRRGMNPSEEGKGEGAMVSTVDDLLRWLAHLRAPEKIVGNAKTWQAMTEPATLASGYKTQYACGIIRNRYRGVEQWQHGGSLIGLATQLATVPSRGLDIAILANCELYNPVALSQQVIDVMVGDAALEAKPEPVSFDRFKHLEGARYHADTGFLIGFGDVGGKLGFTMLHSPLFPGLEEHGDVLQLGGGGQGPYVFKTADLAADPEGHAPPRLVMTDAGTDIRFARLDTPPPSTLAVGRELVGRYAVADFGTTARIEIEPGDVLALHIDSPQGARSATLEALAPRVFGLLVRDPVFPARYAFTVDAKADTKSGRRGFSLEGGRSRHIRFEPIGD